MRQADHADSGTTKDDGETAQRCKGGGKAGGHMRLLGDKGGAVPQLKRHLGDAKAGVIGAAINAGSTRVLGETQKNWRRRWAIGSCARRPAAHREDLFLTGD